MDLMEMFAIEDVGICNAAPRTAAFCTNSREWREVPAQEFSEDVH